MDLSKHIATLQGRGYTVEEDPEDAPGVGRITGHGVLVTLPLDGPQAAEAWAQWASDEQHAANIDASESEPLPEPDETQTMIDTLRARGYTVLRDA